MNHWKIASGLPLSGCLCWTPSRAELVFTDGFETPCDLGDTDTDGDRLSGCQEKQLQTDPVNPDTDGDGLSDGDEALGTLGGLNLPAMGVSPRRKVILLEYDWFVENAEEGSNVLCPIGLHSHEPQQASLDMVTVMFGAAPVANPNGVPGINIIHDVGQGGSFTGGSVVPDLSGSDGIVIGSVNGDDYDAHYATHFAANRKGYFHYVLMPRRYTYQGQNASSGIAEYVATDFRDEIIVSLYCFATVEYVGRIIAHELGHNLGLHHGGAGSSCNGKPNYNSLMNYRYTLEGVDTNCDSLGNGVEDFSRGQRAPLDENNLDENKGVCGDIAVDWNLDSAITTGLKYDLNPGACGNTTYGVLSDHNDWANMIIDMASYGGGPVIEEDVSCPSVTEMEAP